MSKKDKYEWLKKLCWYDGGMNYHPEIEEPFTAVVNGQRATVATDAHVAIAVYEDLGYPEPEKDYLVNIGVSGGVLYRPKEAYFYDVEMSVSELKGFAGDCEIPDRAEPKPECETCSGDEYIKCPECEGNPPMCECSCGHEHPEICSKCYGEGHVDCPDCYEDPGTPCREGILLNRFINLNLLALLLEHIHDETVQVGGKEVVTQPLFFEGEDFRGLLMPIRVDENDISQFPSYRPTGALAEEL